MNPKTSSSHNLHPSEEKLPLRSKSSRLNSTPDFDFCVRCNSDHGFSYADELFSDGKILPLDGSTNRIETNPAKTNPRTLIKPAAANHRFYSDATDEARRERSNPGCGFRLMRSKSVGFSLRKTKKDSPFASDYRNVDRRKSLQKVNSTERASKSGVGALSNPALNVPLADLFCLGSVFPGGRDKRT